MRLINSPSSFIEPAPFDSQKIEYASPGLAPSSTRRAAQFRVRLDVFVKRNWPVS